ncbi:Ubiquitin-60S ribosomal protein L40 [Hondaea fermentalgiana]|uniref:Ubiquitin-60S ribosomal protein L40 n=1 Tax=Hondaea fermentalgiana TaxID=2315210 RepID=A0A2R5GL42_9STRA|nr:Ubiquitin-60S ribosomal protein L40 [Hondaea fermentalgiana]|eukprot:GBG31590.1 Ubiquitin-60S ribosomal protein L40 [Hondaea fermentalgiana]
MSMYVRVKRQDQTVFLRAEASDTFRTVKVALGDILSLVLDDIKLYGKDKETVLEDEGTLGGFEIGNDDVIFWGQRMDGSTFEPASGN